MSETPMNDPENADLSRAYAATARDKPAAALDGAILAKARSAMLTETHRAQESRPGTRASSRHWSQLAALAATLVVTASLVVLMEVEQPQFAVLAPAAPDAALAPAAQTPTEAVQAAEVAPAKAAQKEEKPLARGKLDRPTRDLPSEPRSREREQPATPSPQLADAVKAAIPAPERQAFPAARMAAAEQARPPAAAPAPPSALARADSGAQQPSVAAPATASNASGAALAERRSLQAAETAVRNLVNPGTAKKDESPEAWLARIAELRKLGRSKEAEESFAEFRKRYPDYPIAAAKAQFPSTDK